MKKGKLKNYAPAARRDFIRAVTDRAHLLGLSETGAEPVEIKGDVVLITGRPYPAKVAAQRKGLEARIRRDGFGPVMEAVAYTWFNRFAALRYMEVHGYLEHGFRVLSNPNGGVIPEILEQAANVTLSGLERDKVVALKLDGNKDAELYRLLLVAQCNALATAMPFLFERIDDETELLLPDNLLHSDSLIRKLVTDIDEEDWQQVEIIGWLYQFYISEKKDEVIGKVVKSEDIPAATQLFTPNWIVQYLVQNSVGRLWLMANPASTLKSQWPYYIQPAEQTPEVQAQLDALIQTRINEPSPSPLAGEGRGEGALASGATLNPETITVLDPACGSGHILVEAYAVLKAIYLERGYQPRAIPRLILEKNLYGLDIDDRAAQLAGFALLMKARADDRRLLDDPPKLNVLALQEGKGLNADALVGRVSPKGVTQQTTAAFADPDLFPASRPQMTLGESGSSGMLGYATVTKPTLGSQASRLHAGKMPALPATNNASTIAVLIDTFAHAKTFGSLIQISDELTATLPELRKLLTTVLNSGDLFSKDAAESLMPLLRQAEVGPAARNAGGQP